MFVLTDHACLHFATGFSLPTGTSAAVLFTQTLSVICRNTVVLSEARLVRKGRLPGDPRLEPQVTLFSLSLSHSCVTHLLLLKPLFCLTNQSSGGRISGYVYTGSKSLRLEMASFPF